MSEAQDTRGGDAKLESEALAIRARPRPVARISRRVLVVLSGTVLLVIFGAMILALDPPRFRPLDTRTELYRTDNVPRPEALEALPDAYDGLGRAEPVRATYELGPPLPGDIGPAVVSAERDLGLSSEQQFRPAPEEDAVRAERLRQARLAQQGRESQVFFDLNARRSQSPGDAAGTTAGNVPQAPDATAPLRNALTDFIATTAPGQALPTDAGAMAQTRTLDFLNQDVDPDIYNPFSLQDPVSPYQIMAGTIISASLITGVKSDLPGQVIAQVTENLYDTVTGRYLLIPQGSRLIGTYDSVIAFGQRRALLVWRRIILPDGSSILIENAPATDVAGYAGLEDDVDFHTWRLLRGIALSTLLGVSTELTFGNEESDLVRAIRESVQGNANRAGQEIVERNLDIQPTITIRPGWPLRIIVNKDLVLRPYRVAGALQ